MQNSAKNRDVCNLRSTDQLVEFPVASNWTNLSISCFISAEGPGIFRGISPAMCSHEKNPALHVHYTGYSIANP